MIFTFSIIFSEHSYFLKMIMLINLKGFLAQTRIGVGRELKLVKGPLGAKMSPL